LFDAALVAWERWINNSNQNSLEVDYKRLFDSLQYYIDKYYTDSWETALSTWWSTK
jgi:hypothetical protein